jgi:adhesin transport system outer membrane protein
VVNARQDLQLAFVRTHAGLGTLLPALELQRLDAQRGQDMTGWNSAAEPAQNCPMEPVTAYTPDKPALLQRAAELSKQVSLLNARERALAELTVAPSPGGSPAPASAEAPPASRAADPAAAPAAERLLREALEAWRSAWSRGDADAYLGAYADRLSPNPKLERTAWETARRTALAHGGAVQIEITDVRVEALSTDRASTVFTQRYNSDRYSDVVVKTLLWQRIGDAWRILQETSVPAER